jgi:hypothetical protein
MGETAAICGGTIIRWWLTVQQGVVYAKTMRQRLTRNSIATSHVVTAVHSVLLNPWNRGYLLCRAYVPLQGTSYGSDITLPQLVLPL